MVNKDNDPRNDPEYQKLRQQSQQAAKQTRLADEVVRQWAGKADGSKPPAFEELASQVGGRKAKRMVEEALERGGAKPGLFRRKKHDLTGW